MAQLSNVFIAGFSISFITAGMTGLSFLHFLYKSDGEERRSRLNGADLELKRSKFIDVYLTCFVSSVLMGVLYLIQYYGQGLWLMPGPMFIIWFRWLFIAFIGAAYMRLLGYVLCRRFTKRRMVLKSDGEVDHMSLEESRKQSASSMVLPHLPKHKSQSFHLVVVWLLAIISLFVGTLSQTQNLKIVWGFFSIFWVFVSIIILFFPYPLLMHDHTTVRDIALSEPSIWPLMFTPTKDRTKELSMRLWAYVLPWFLFAQIIISFIGYIIIWFLSDANQFTDIITLRNTLISYLVFDMIFIFPFIFIVCVLNAAGMQEKWVILDRQTGRKTYNSLAPVVLNALPLYASNDDILKRK